MESLSRRGATFRTPGRPARYRAADPQVLLVQLAAEQGEQLERLSRALSGIRLAIEPVTRTLDGARSVATVTQQLVARAERSIDGVLAAELWHATLPAWRRAASRATLRVRIAGDAGNMEGMTFPSAPADHPTLLLIDGVHALIAAPSNGALSGVWSSHPQLARLAQMALGSP